MSLLGRKIKNRRENIGMSADKLGELIGKDRATIYRYENGSIDSMKIDALIPIAKALGVSPGYFLDENTEESHSMPSLTPTEQAIVDDFRLLNSKGQEKAKEYIADLKDNPKYSIEKSEPDGKAVIHAVVTGTKHPVVKIDPEAMKIASTKGKKISVNLPNERFVPSKKTARTGKPKKQKSSK